MTPTEDYFQRSWDELICKAQFVPRERPFESLQDDFLVMMEGFDISGLPGRIPPGIYRQKGNRFKDLIGTLIRRRCNLNFIEREIEGLTDRHVVDLVFPARGSPEIAMEVKMAGRPEHIDEAGTKRPLRGGEVDLDKRLKEVKYTPIDLKLRYSGTVVKDWDSWVKESVPYFYTIYGFFLGNPRRLDRTVEKFVKLASHYNNGVGLFLYLREGDRYVAVIDHPDLKNLRIDDVVGEVCRKARSIVESGLKFTEHQSHSGNVDRRHGGL